MKMWNAAEEAKYKVNGIMLNLDNTIHGYPAMTCQQDANDWANQFKGTHITDVVMNFSESQCIFPDEEFGWYGAKYLQKMENGHPVDYSHLKDWYEHFMVHGRDYLKYLSKALPEAGINMWLSMRMNDAHDRTSKETSMLFSDFYHKNPHLRRVQYPSQIEGYFSKCLDFGKEEIRKHYLGLMDRALDRYDVYGFQFEWQREIRLWHIGGEYNGTEILNQFHRDAKAIITKYEKKYGHKIKFSVQVAPDLYTNYEFGLDVMRWVSEGLVDMVVPKGRFSTTHNEMPVAHWKSLLEPYGVELAPDIDANIHCGVSNAPRVNHDFETYAGTAALYLSQGADKIQTYNILPLMDHRFQDDDKVGEYTLDVYQPKESTYPRMGSRRYWMLFTSLGSYDKLMTMNRKVLPTYNDVAPNWGMKGIRDVQLPRELSTDTSACLLHIGMGDVAEGSKVTLKVGASVIDADNPPVVYVNSQPTKFIGVEAAKEYYYTANGMYCYELPKEVYGDMFAVAEIQAPNVKGSEEEKVEMTVDYAEIYIEAAK